MYRIWDGGDGRAPGVYVSIPGCFMMRVVRVGGDLCGDGGLGVYLTFVLG